MDQIELEGVEGLTMYLSEDDVRTMLGIIARRFSCVTVFCEVLSPRFVGKDVERSIAQSGSRFTWGAKDGAELAALCPSLRWEGDRSLVEGMQEISPAYRLLGKIGPIRSLSNKIYVLSGDA